MYIHIANQQDDSVSGIQWPEMRFVLGRFQGSVFKELGIPRGFAPKAPETPDRRDQVKDALDTAHRIREFEIELYWKRTLYMWGVTAALLAIFALVLSNGPTINVLPKATTPEIYGGPGGTQLLFGGLISLMALIISILWACMAAGAKFWQNNWERHVDLLEEDYGVNLYKVYPDAGADAPYSVTKINGAMIRTIIGFWFVSFLTIIALLAVKWGIVDLPERKWIGLSFGGAMLIGYIAGCLTFIFCNLRMSNPGKQIFPETHAATKESPVKHRVLRSRR